MNDVTNTTGLLVCNPITTEHLIKCMVRKERCRRPNIWEVYDHPCWTGKEVECNSEYCGDDEVDDNATDDVDVEGKMEMASTSDMERERIFVAKMREMGFNRKPTILVFDRGSHHLHRFNFENKSMTRMHSYPDRQYFAAIAFNEYIHFFERLSRSNHRLEYCDVTATWERMSWPDGIKVIDWRPCITASSDSFFLVGRFGERFVFKYNPPLDRWERLHSSINFCQTAVCSNGFLYYIARDKFVLSKANVERLNLETMKWERMADTYIRGDYHVAVKCGENIYVIGGKGGTSQTGIMYIEKYDPNVDDWTELQPVTISDLRDKSIFNAFAIYGDLYIVSYTHILKYDVQKNELITLASFPDMEFEDAVLVRMSD